jgi:4-carboxymuconolactone decarboxylase
MPRLPHQHYLSLKQRHPDFISAVEALGTAAQSSGPLDPKTVHLIQLAAAAATRSHGGAHSHTIRALEAGATPEEVRHAVIVLAGTIGFPSAAAALAWVDDVIERGY